MSVTMRPAQPGDAGPLSSLALASKAYWGYDVEFMAACRDDLTVQARDIEGGGYWVAVEGKEIVGFYSLKPDAAGRPYLKDLFLAPASIGRGLGRLLWKHLLEQAKRLGWTFFLLDSEPYAEGFYTRMGAVRIGEVASTVFPGRVLPLMRVDLE